MGSLKGANMPFVPRPSRRLCSFVLVSLGAFLLAACGRDVRAEDVRSPLSSGSRRLLGIPEEPEPSKASRRTDTAAASPRAEPASTSQRLRQAEGRIVELSESLERMNKDLETAHAVFTGFIQAAQRAVTELNQSLDRAQSELGEAQAALPQTETPPRPDRDAPPSAPSVQKPEERVLVGRPPTAEDEFAGMTPGQRNIARLRKRLVTLRQKAEQARHRADAMARVAAELQSMKKADEER